MYIAICEIVCQSRLDAWDRALRAGAKGRPWGLGWGGSWEGGSGWGTQVHLWLIHVNVWQKPLQYYKAISLQLNKLIFLKDDAVKVLHSICQKTWKTQEWPQDWKRSVFIPIPKKAMSKNAQTTAQLHSSHTLAK